VGVSVLSLYIVSVSFNEAGSKGKQMQTQGDKTRSGRQDGYFAEEYMRAFEGDAYSDPVRQRRQDRLKAKEKNVAKEWIPQKGTKWPSVSPVCVVLYSLPISTPISIITIKVSFAI